MTCLLSDANGNNVQRCLFRATVIEVLYIMEGKRLPLFGALLLNLLSVTVSGQFSYGDMYGGRDYDYGSGGGNAVDVGCPDFGPMDSFNAEGLQRGKVGGGRGRES